MVAFTEIGGRNQPESVAAFPRIRWSQSAEYALLARYGGEEFIAVLPKTDLAGAVGVAEKLRGYVEQTRFLFRGDRIPLTVSIGVSTAEESDKSVKSVLDRVDKGLYTAKKKGRNCVSAI